MSRHLHARQRPRRVLAAALTVARDWWDRANKRMERRDVFAHVPQAPAGWSPAGEWGDPVLEVHHPGTLPGPAGQAGLGRAGEPYLPALVRAENAAATAAPTARAPVPDQRGEFTETGYTAAQKARLAGRLAQERTDEGFASINVAGIIAYCFSGLPDWLEGVTA